MTGLRPSRRSVRAFRLGASDAALRAAILGGHLELHRRCLGKFKGLAVKGPDSETRLSFTSGTVQVIADDMVITVITR